MLKPRSSKLSIVGGIEVKQLAALLPRAGGPVIPVIILICTNILSCSHCRPARQLPIYNPFQNLSASWSSCESSAKPPRRRRRVEHAVVNHSRPRVVRVEASPSPPPSPRVKDRTPKTQAAPKSVSPIPSAQGVANNVLSPLEYCLDHHAEKFALPCPQWLLS